MKWCEHMNHPGTYELKSTSGPHGSVYIVGPQMFYCPICGTPRPKEKTLAEKFYEAGLKYLWWKEPHEGGGSPMAFCGQLAKIAEDHFKETW